MILVDTNVLMDVFAADPKWADWSIARLDEWSRRGPLFVNPVIYAELGAHAIKPRSISKTPPSTGDRIILLRDRRVILDSHLAELYGVSTGRLNEQVKRNAERFPEDFAFVLTEQEWESLRSQIATLKMGRGSHRKYRPYAFTEHGALMAAGVLNSPQAIELSIYLVRAFVALRESAAHQDELRARLDELEHRIEGKLANQDRAITDILAAIRSLMDQPRRQNRPIGFVTSPK